MSEAHDVPSAATAVWPHLARGDDGEFGESGVDTARRVQMDGVAKPADTSLFGDRTTNGQARPSPTTPARGGDVLDPGTLRLPEGYEAGSLMPEAADLARELGVGNKGLEKALNLMTRSIEANENAYARELEVGVDRLQRELNPTHVAIAKELINDPAFTPAELKPWFARWGNHPAVARMLTQWAAAIGDARSRRW
jgi:hypothetical protein